MQLKSEALQAAVHAKHMNQQSAFLLAAGSGDSFLEVQLKPEAFQAVECRTKHQNDLLLFFWFLSAVGSGDSFLEVQLKPEAFQAAADAAGFPVTMRMQEGYDHR